MGKTGPNASTAYTIGRLLSRHPIVLAVAAFGLCGTYAWCASRSEQEPKPEAWADPDVIAERRLAQAAALEEVQAEQRAREGQKPAPATYTLLGSDRPDFAGTPRLSWRVQVQPGLSRDALTAVLRRAAWEAYQGAPVKVGAVMVFGYSSADTKGAYTAGRAVYAPHGEWSKADPRVPPSDWAFTIDLADGYLEERPAVLAAGSQAELVGDGASTVLVSRKPDSWGDDDAVVEAPVGTKVRIVGQKEFNVVEGRSMLRYEVVTTAGKRGWVHARSLRALRSLR